MSRLLDRALLLNALASVQDKAELFSIINGFPSVDDKIVIEKPSFDRAKELMCDNYCRFPHFCNEEQLMEHCALCPMDSLEDGE